ncbi:hypothetical protein TNCV_3218571 [Trichonephila clavipes]|nr:hypothetical protein TNCV_3218571 [Trichonephila clavipes]
MPVVKVVFSTIQMRVRFSSLPPHFRMRTPWSSQRPPTNLIRGLGDRGLFRVSPCHKDTKHLQTSMPFPGFEPRPYGTAFSVGMAI